MQMWSFITTEKILKSVQVKIYQSYFAHNKNWWEINIFKILDTFLDFYLDNTNKNVNKIAFYLIKKSFAILILCQNKLDSW